MAAGDCWSAGVLARFVGGGEVPSWELVVSGGEVATPTLRATIKKTGASTSAATERQRLVAVPLRTRRNDTIAGIIAKKHSRNPNAAAAGITASSAPRTATTNVTAPRPLRGDGDWSAFIGCIPFSLLPDPLSTTCEPVLQRRVEDPRSRKADTPPNCNGNPARRWAGPGTANHALAGRAGLRDGHRRQLLRLGWVGRVWHPIDLPEGYHTSRSEQDRR